MTTLPTTWSYSRWDTWRTCPLKYKLQFIDKEPTVQSPAMARGNKVHLALAAYITGKGTLPPEVKTPYHQTLYAEMRAFPNKIVEQQWGFSASWKATGYFGKDVWLRSILDAALMYEDDTVEVVDHKTGKRYGSNDDQVELFALVAMHRLPMVNHVTTRLVYVDAGEEQIDEVSAKGKDKLTAKWAGLVAPMFADRAWAARPNDKCKFCPFAKSAGGQCFYG